MKYKVKENNTLDMIDWTIEKYVDGIGWVGDSPIFINKEKAEEECRRRNCVAEDDAEIITVGWATREEWENLMKRHNLKKSAREIILNGVIFRMFNRSITAVIIDEPYYRKMAADVIKSEINKANKQ